MDNRQNSLCGHSTRNNSGTELSSQCRTLKKRFNEIEFAINETVLYLDAYPENTDALNYYHNLIEERNMLLKAIIEQCGPMTQYDNESVDSWQWVKGPWPWKFEAN